MPRLSWFCARGAGSPGVAAAVFWSIVDVVVVRCIGFITGAIQHQSRDGMRRGSLHVLRKAFARLPAILLRGPDNPWTATVNCRTARALLVSRMHQMAIRITLSNQFDAHEKASLSLARFGFQILRLQDASFPGAPGPRTKSRQCLLGDSVNSEYDALLSHRSRSLRAGRTTMPAHARGSSTIVLVHGPGFK